MAKIVMMMVNVFAETTKLLVKNVTYLQMAITSWEAKVIVVFMGASHSDTFQQDRRGHIGFSARVERTILPPRVLISTLWSECEA